MAQRSRLAWVEGPPTKSECCRRYQPEEEGDEGDSEDQPWHFVFNSPSDCRRHHMPAGASEWLRSPAAAAAAAADAQAAGAAAQAAAGGQAEEAAPGEALVATQQAGVPQEAEQHGPALAEPPLPPLPAEQMHQPKRRRRASTTVRGRQQAASGPSHAAAPPLPSLAHVVQRASLVCSPQDQPAAGLSAAAGQEQDGGAPAGLHTMAAAAAGEAAGEPPAAPGGGWATGAWRAAAAAEQQSVSRTTPQPQLTEAEVTAALQQAGALQFAQASEPWDPAQQRAPAPAAPAPLSMPGAELPTPQALPQPPAAQRVDGHQAQQQAQEPVRPQEQHSPQLPPPMQQAQQAQHSQPPPQAAAEAGWGGLMARLTRVAQRCVDAGLLDQATAWRVRGQAGAVQLDVGSGLLLPRPCRDHLPNLRPLIAHPLLLHCSTASKPTARAASRSSSWLSKCG